MRCIPVNPAIDLFASDLPEATVEQGEDFLLNLRIVQQTQEALFESLVLLRLLDLVISFGSILHCMTMPRCRQPSVPVCNTTKRRRTAKSVSRTTPITLFPKIRSIDSQKSVRMAILLILVFLGRLTFHSSENTGAVRMAIGLGTKENQ